MTQSDNNSDVTDYSFNPTGKIASVDFDNGLAYDYQYDSESNRVQTVEDDGISPPTTTDYYYDALLNSALSGPVLEIRSDDSGLFNLRADNGLLATQAYSPDIVTPGDFTGAEVNAGMYDGFNNLVELASIIDSGSAWETQVTAFGTSVNRDDIDGIGNQTGYLGRPTITPQGTDGLIDMNARSYNPELGRFISVDPLEGNSMMPQSMNPYAYGANNPYLWPDPTGMSIFSDVGGAAGGIAGDVAGLAEDGVNYVAGAVSPCVASAYYGMDQACYYLTGEIFKDGVSMKEFAGFEWENRQELAAMGVGMLCAVPTAGSCLAIGAGVFSLSIGDNWLQSRSGVQSFIDRSKDTLIISSLSLIPALKLTGSTGVVIRRGVATAPKYARPLAEFSLSMRFGPLTIYEPARIYQRENNAK